VTSCRCLCAFFRAPIIDGSTVLNTKKFGILPGLVDPDVLQSIQALPGVESTNESIANINVRGGQTTRI
jgi:hypothetical protein